ncbi:MAG TPA: hypothetical protein QGF35_07535 [Dehalococcoidia bacterium]|nr:hypothetical protein [Dehalococcoidia bacterium]
MRSQEARVLPLNDLHSSKGARFAEVASWLIVEDYREPEAELAKMRESSVILDRSHRSRFMVTGPDAAGLLNRATAGTLKQLSEGQTIRACIVDSAGRISDLLLISQTGAISYLVSGEPGRRRKTAAQLGESLSPDLEVKFEDRTESTCSLAIEGPASSQFLSAQIGDDLDRTLSPFHCRPSSSTASARSPLGQQTQARMDSH